MNIRYKIVESTRLGDMAVEVTKLLDEGWKLNGRHVVFGHGTAPTYYSQSLYKPATK